MKDWMKNIEFVLKYDAPWNSEGVQEDIEFQFGKIANEMGKLYCTSCVIVVVKNCDNCGAYDTMDIHVFGNFIEANHLLNTEMYKSNALDIYHYNCIKNEFTLVMDKCYDSTRFGRLAGINKQKMFDDQMVYKMRHVFNMKETKVTLHPMQL